MAHIILMLSLCFRLGEFLAFWVQIDALEITHTSQFLQMLFVLFAINALLCQNALTLLRLASLLALLFGEFGGEVFASLSSGSCDNSHSCKR